MATKYLYFAYGSNLNKRQMKFRCPESIPVGMAWLEEHQLEFLGNSKGGGVANVRKNEDSIVDGGLWEVPKRDWPALDRYEGYPRLYDRAKRQVLYKDESGQKRYIEAIIYIMNDGFVPASPSVEYLTTILNGYEDFGVVEHEYKKLMDAFGRHGGVIKW